MNTPDTPEQAIIHQHGTLEELSRRLATIVQQMEDTLDPGSATWETVAERAQVTTLAGAMLDTLNEVAP